MSNLKLPPIFKLTNTDIFAAWFVVTRDATPDEIRVVRTVLRHPLGFVSLSVKEGRTRHEHQPARAAPLRANL